jgi:hypothetical protein
LFQIEKLVVQISDPPKTVLDVIDEPLLCNSPCFHVNKAALKRMSISLLKKGPYHFDLPITNLVRGRKNIEAAVEGFGAIFYGQPTITPDHFDGAMHGTLLTLLVGEKEWTVHNPKRDTVYTICQNEGQTVYIPPGFSHQVTTHSQTSEAYGAMWKCDQKKRVDLFCQNQKHLRSDDCVHKNTISADMKLYISIPKKKKGRDFEKLISVAGRIRAKQQGGTRRRYKDGRKRSSKKLTTKKSSRK